MSAQITVIEVQSDLRRYSKVASLFIAWFITYTIASVSQSQFVLYELQSLGIEINGNLWLEHTVLDWWGLLPKYGSGIFVALSIAFYSTEYLSHYITNNRKLLFSLAGGAAMLTLLLSMRPILDATLIAGARSLGGQCWQVIAGVIGGILYAILRLDLVRWIIQRPKQNTLV